MLIVHTLHNLLTFSGVVYLTSELPYMIVVVWIIIEGLLEVYGLYLIRKAKRSEIIALWDKKWSR